MNPLNMIISITFNPLQNFAKRASQAVFQPKEKRRSGGIHNSWNSLTKSACSKLKMLVLLKIKAALNKARAYRVSLAKMSLQKYKIE